MESNVQRKCSNSKLIIKAFSSEYVISISRAGRRPRDSWYRSVAWRCSHKDIRKWTKLKRYWRKGPSSQDVGVTVRTFLDADPHIWRRTLHDYFEYFSLIYYTRLSMVHKYSLFIYIRRISLDLLNVSFVVMIFVPLSYYWLEHIIN